MIGVTRNLFVAVEHTKASMYYRETGFTWFTRYDDYNHDGPTRLGFAMDSFRHVTLALRDVYWGLEHVRH